MLTRRGFAVILVYYRETAAARTELTQGTEAKVRTQNFRKAPRQRDRNLRKGAAAARTELRKEPQLQLCGVAVSLPSEKDRKSAGGSCKSNRTVTSLYVERWYTYILAAYVIKKDRKDDKNGI